MGNLDFSNFAPGYDSDVVKNAEGFAGMTPGNRISAEQFAEAAAETGGVSPEAAALIQKEIMRQLAQVEPLYKLIHGLRVYVSQSLLKGMRDYKPAEMGFHVPTEENPNATELIKRVEQTVKFLNVLFEDMQGMATEITTGIRRMSLGMQTQLTGFVFKLKDYASDGEIDRSMKSEFYEDLMKLQILLGDQELALEMTRGKIK